MAEHAAARLHIGHGVAAKRTRNARQARQVEQLRKGHDGRRLTGAELQHRVRGHLHIAQHRGARSGQPLAKAAPVIEPLHTRRIAGHQRMHRLVGLAGHHGAGQYADPVGIETAGAVELLAIEPPVAGRRRVGLQGGLQAAYRPLPHLGGCIAKGGALGHQGQPVALRLGCALVEHAVHKQKVRPQDLGQVGVGLSQVHQQGHELLQRRAAAPPGPGQAQGGKATVPQPLQRCMGQAAAVLALGRPFGNACKHRRKALLQISQARWAGIARLGRLACQCGCSHGAALAVFFQGSE